MELKINYQYTYFIYPFAIEMGRYKKYIQNLLRSKKYSLKFFDSFKDIDLYNYFIPSIKENTFQDFTFTKDKINAFYKLNYTNQYKELLKQNCIMFEYNLEDSFQGKIEEKDGIFFSIQKIELLCFKTGICFLLFKTHIEESDKFSDLLNFNHKFGNLNLENKNLKKLNTIKIQTDTFSNMKYITEIISELSSKKISSKELEIDENLFLTYGYVCLDSSCWDKEHGFENIENEFIKYSNLYQSNTNINVDYDKLTMLTNSSYMKLRINHKGCFLISSSTDSKNYTKLPYLYEKQYLYTYIIALHQRYYLKKLSKDLSKKRHNKTAIKEFINFTKEEWINEITTETLGQKIYNRCKEKLNLETLYQEVKNKYDIFYKEKKIEKKGKQFTVLIIITLIAALFAAANLATLFFFK